MGHPFRDRLKLMSPAFQDKDKGGLDLAEKLLEMTALVNDVKAKYNALLAKMDTDFTAQNGAVTSSQLDVNYESTGEVTLPDVDLET